MDEFDVTYLTVDSIQEGVGASQITPLVVGLAKMQKKICLISYEKTNPTNELRNLFSKAGVEWIVKEFGSTGPVAGVRRMLELRNNLPASQILHGRSDIATVSGILGNAEAPMLWDVRSLWSDQRLLINSPGWNQVTARGARTLENISARKSTAMVTLTSAIVPILQMRHNKLPEIRQVIPTCVQTSRFLPSSMPKGELTCLMSGTYNNYYDLERTKQVITEIRKSIQLKVIWAKPAESPRDSLGVGEDLVLEMKNSEMPSIVQKSHFGIAICRQDDSGSLAAAVPTKIGEFLSSGRPVIVSKGIGDLDSLLTETNTGIIIGIDDSLERISDKVTGLISDKSTPERCRSLAMSHFDMEQAIMKYATIYGKMQK